MKAGSSIGDIATQLKHIRENSLDLHVSTNALTMGLADDRPDILSDLAHKPKIYNTDNTNHVKLRVPETDILYKPSTWAHSQIANRFEIHKPYYDRLNNGDTDDQALLVKNINHWMGKTETVSLVRLIDKSCRAFLSNKYRPLDNYDLLEAIFPTLEEHNFTIESAALDEKHMYIKAIAHHITVQPKVGDHVSLGVSIRNSDVGCSSINISPFLFRRICNNGMDVNDMAVRQRHIGKRQGTDTDALVHEYLSDETKQAEDKALWLKVRDTVKACVNEVVIEKVQRKMTTATQVNVDVANPITTEVVIKQVSDQMQRPWSKEESSGIIERLITEGDFTQYGMANAVTNLASDVDTYERASELESDGWKVLNLHPHSFKEYK